jgi:uncharacterized phage-like protein YoqJ
MRRQFQLPSDDHEYLEALGKDWEAVIDAQNQWVIVGGFDVPNGYNHQAVSVALRLPATYPDVQIDMAYFFPDLARADGKQINALSPLALDGKTWQQWSRHRAADGWRPGIDNIETHLLYVRAWLESELKKR